MRDPQKIKTIVQAVSDSVSLPVTIKTRTGLSPNHINIDEVRQAAEEGGAKAIFIHGRLACNHHNGPADWEIIENVKKKSGIPVIGNGGINSAAEAISKMTELDIDGIMIGRAALGNPWIFLKIKELIQGKSGKCLSMDDRLNVIKDHYQNTIKNAANGEKQSAHRTFKAHLLKYFSGYKGIQYLRKMLSDLDTEEKLFSAVNLLMDLN